MNICILANNMDFFKILIENLPDNLKNAKFYVFTDTRLGYHLDDIHLIMTGLTYSVITDLDVNYRLPIRNKFVEDCTMSLNFLMPWYMFKFNDIHKALFIDEDVVLTDRLLDEYHTHKNAFWYNKFRGYNETYNVSPVLLEICKCCNYELDVDIWKKNATSGGQFILSDFDVNSFEQAIINFFSSDLVSATWYKRRVWNTECLDERLLNAFFIKHSMIGEKFNVCILQRTNYDDAFLSRRYNDKSLIHFMVKSKKREYVNRMIDMGILKGDKI